MRHIFLPAMAFFYKDFGILLSVLLPGRERPVVEAYIPSIYLIPPPYPIAFICPAAFFLRAGKAGLLNAVMLPQLPE